MKTIACSTHYTKEQFRKLSDYADSLDIKLIDIPIGSTDISLVKDCDALFGEFSDELLSAARHAVWLQSCWDGTDGLVGKPIVASGQVILTNAAGAYDTMIAEYLLGGCLTMLHHFLPYYRSQQQGVWHPCIPADSLRGKRVTVLGCGRIGSEFARMADALGAIVTGVTRSRKAAPSYIREILSIDDLDAILPDTDILVMMLPMTKDNDHLMDARRLALLPKGAYLLNAGRGKPLDAYAAGEALRSGHLAGAVLDVFPEEPLEKDDPLWDCPNLLITPHVAGKDRDPYNMANILEIFRENMTRWAAGEPLKHVIDVNKGY